MFKTERLSEEITVYIPDDFSELVPKTIFTSDTNCKFRVFPELPIHSIINCESYYPPGA